MSDELNLMLLAIKNYAKSEYNAIDDDDARTLHGIRDWVKNELKDYQTFHYGFPDTSSPEYNQKFGYFRCISTMERVLRKYPTP